MVIEKVLSGVSVANDILQAAAYGLCFVTGAKGSFICTETLDYMDVVVGSMREKRSSARKDGISVAEVKEINEGEHYVLKDIFFYKSSLGWYVGLDSPDLEPRYLSKYIESYVSIAYPIFHSLLRCEAKDKNRDQLTGCYTREEFFVHLRSNLKTMLKKRFNLYIFYMDFNNFKTVNDYLGHRMGDKVLASIAEEIRSVFSGYGAVYRIGGDEFAGICFGIDDRKASLIAREIEAVTRQAPCGMFVSVSVGVRKFTGDGYKYETEEELENLATLLLGEAEQEMYENKRRKKRSNKIDCSSCPYYQHGNQLKGTAVQGNLPEHSLLY